MSLILPVLLCGATGPLLSLGDVSSPEKYKISIDWARFRINVAATIAIDENLSVTQRDLIRSQAKERILTRASLYLEEFFVDANWRISDVLNDNRQFSREYSLFLETIELGSLFFRSSKIETNLVIPIRGRRGLLNRVPLPWATERYQLLRKSEYIGEAYQQREAHGEYDSSLSPVRYTGLLIDARELDLRPSLAPRIYSQDGKLLYGPEYLTAQAGTSRGVASYVTEYGHKEVSRRAGRHPLLTAALSVQGRYQTNLVIASEDAARLFDHPDTLRNLQKCKVVIMVK